MDEVADNLDIYVNYANPDNHVPGIDWNNLVIQERFRIACYRLPYNKIPRLMIRHLLIIVTTKLNIFPAKGGCFGILFSSHDPKSKKLVL